jgi:pimeloyl-ACP methyl ester carboxylesterase
MGLGTPVVLLPGLVCDATVWTHFSAALDGRAATTIPGYESLDSLGAMAERVLRDAPPRFALAGHSMGGRVALEVLRRAPERVAAIALLDTGVLPLATGEHGQREAAGRHELLQIARDHGMAAMATRWVQVVGRDSAVALISGRRHVCAQLGGNIRGQIRALLAPDANELLPEFAVGLVLCGEPGRRRRPSRNGRANSRRSLELIPQCGTCTHDGRKRSRAPCSTVTRAFIVR